MVAADQVHSEPQAAVLPILKLLLDIVGHAHKPFSLERACRAAKELAVSPQSHPVPAKEPPVEVPSNITFVFDPSVSTSAVTVLAVTSEACMAVLPPPLKVHKFVAHVGSVLIRKVLTPGEHANTPAPVVETELSVAQLVIATGLVHPPHVISVPEKTVLKTTFCPCVRVPTAADTTLAEAAIDETGVAVVTVRVVIVKVPVIVHTFDAQSAAVLMRKLLAVGEQAYTPAPYETEFNRAKVFDVQPPHVPTVPVPTEK